MPEVWLAHQHTTLLELRLMIVIYHGLHFSQAQNSVLQSTLIGSAGGIVGKVLDSHMANCGSSPRTHALLSVSLSLVKLKIK